MRPFVEHKPGKYKDTDGSLHIIQAIITSVRYGFASIETKSLRVAP